MNTPSRSSSTRIITILVTVATVIIFGWLVFRMTRTSQPTVKPGAAGLTPEAAASDGAPPAGTASEAPQQVSRSIFQANGQYLVIEVLTDRLLHFEVSANGKVPEAEEPLYTTPMVVKNDYPGPLQFSATENSLETAELSVSVDPNTLCFSVSDSTKSPAVNLTRLCPLDLTEDWKGLTITSEATRNLYGLGEYFSLTCANGTGPGQTCVDWTGRVRRPGNDFGNAMVSFSGGSTGNAQFPILYAVGDAARGGEDYALFLDSFYKQQWDFTASPWKVQTWGDRLAGYIFSEPDLPTLRSDFMELVGRPPVPPKKMFGLWISEYGYDNWAELDDKLRTLRENKFPVDGFVMDLQWFGGISNDAATHMGYLTWDEANFPNPAAKISQLLQQGIGLMTIEESYIGQQAPSYEELKSKGYLVKKSATGDPVTLFEWWGIGGYLDWTNPAAGDFWHDQKRQPLISQGVMGFWTDLGEPEMYSKTAWYYGFPDLDLHAERDVHNLYNFLWSESLARGFERNGNTQRPFILSRSGTAGIQRFGAAMWSGDIGTDWVSLRADFTAQLHMSFSGMDYFSSDIGGFHRGTLTGAALDDIYTPWLAASALLDVPARTHTENLCNCKETAPDRVGDLPSNLEAVRLRYELSPYLYSLAHRAYLYGEPYAPPLVFYYEQDPNVSQIADEKLLGRDLLLAVVTQTETTQRDIYFPAGTWFDYYTNAAFTSSGEWRKNIPVVVDSKFRLPLFARAGAIIPQMYVDDKTMNIYGQRIGGGVRDELILRVYPSSEGSTFTLFEDDGATIAYQQGYVRTTDISQQQTGSGITVTVEASGGTYIGASSQRTTEIQLAAGSAAITSVNLNGTPLPELDSQEAFDTAPQGWYISDNGLVLAKSNRLDIYNQKLFEFRW